MKNIEITYNNALLEKEDIRSVSGSLLSYVKDVHSIIYVDKPVVSYEKNESSINLSFDKTILKKVKDTASEIDVSKLKYIIVVGIGGSNLGTKAVYDSIRGSLDMSLVEKVPKIIFLDTTNETFLGDLFSLLKKDLKDKEEVLINVISKSGTTTETISNFEIINSFLSNIFGDIKERIVVTTDSGSKLWERAKKDGLRVLEIPKKVGGRYSVLSSVGLFPLFVSGFDIESLLAGARNMTERCTSEDFDKNPALISAVLIYLYYKKGIKINNNFFFNPELESLGKWYRQLMGESIGKKFDINGKEVFSGITPIVSIGSVDLHSMAQLYFGGPKDKFTTFIYAQNNNKKISVPKDMMFEGLVGGIAGKNISDITSSIFSGVKSSYVDNRLPFIEIELNDVNEYSIGQFLQLKMIEMMYLAHLFGVNAFNQPDVEGYKDETRKILLQK